MKFYCLLACLFCCFPLESSVVTYGMQHYGKDRLNDLTVYGTAELDGTEVTDKLTVSGSLTAKDATIKNLRVHGAVRLKNCSVDQAHIYGLLIAEKTTLHTLAIASEKTILRACSVDTIIIEQSGTSHGVQVLELHDNTQVTGPITFEANNGEIWLFSGSEVAGPVTGATIRKK